MFADNHSNFRPPRLICGPTAPFRDRGVGVGQVHHQHPFAESRSDLVKIIGRERQRRGADPAVHVLGGAGADDGARDARPAENPRDRDSRNRCAVTACYLQLNTARPAAIARTPRKRQMIFPPFVSVGGGLMVRFEPRASLLAALCPWMNARAC
jgi:hypothetical protein